MDAAQKRHERARRYRDAHRDELRLKSKEYMRAKRGNVQNVTPGGSGRMCYVYGLFAKPHVGDNLNGYVGSTFWLFPRLLKHRRNAILERGECPRLYRWAREIGVDNVDFIVLDAFMCDSLDQRYKREGEFVGMLKPTLNIATVGGVTPIGAKW